MSREHQHNPSQDTSGLTKTSTHGFGCTGANWYRCSWPARHLHPCKAAGGLSQLRDDDFAAGTSHEKDAPSAEEEETLLLGPWTDPCLVPAVGTQHLHCHLTNRSIISYFCLKAAIKDIICGLLLTVSKIIKYHQLVV